MNTIIKNATAILGQQLMAVFIETYGDDEKALNEIINEAIQALKYIEEDESLIKMGRDEYYDEAA